MAEVLGSILLNPITYPQSWSYVVVAGMKSPGAISVDGIQGFKRPSDWDIKKGKGAQGATLTLQTCPPAEGSIDFQLWKAEHFVQWKAFRDLLKYKPAKSPSQAFGLYHPSLADLDINVFVTKSISPIRHVGRGLYVVTVEMIEWTNPPKSSIVSTPDKGKTQSPETPGTPPDTVGDALDRQIADYGNKAGLGVFPK